MGYRTDEPTERRQPHRTELDRVTGERPAFIDERGGHARVANSAALAAAGITTETPNPKGGRIGRDLNRSANGLLLESAMRLVADVQPLPGLERRVEGVLKAQELLVSRGITSVGAAVNRGFADDLRAYETLAYDGRLQTSAAPGRALHDLSARPAGAAGAARDGRRDAAGGGPLRPRRLDYLFSSSGPNSPCAAPRADAGGRPGRLQLGPPCIA